MWKIAAVTFFAGACLTADAANGPVLAAPQRPPGAGAPHIGGGAPHFGGGAPHVGGGVAVPHIGGGMPHVGGVPHIGAAAPSFHMARPMAAPHLGIAHAPANFGRPGRLAHSFAVRGPHAFQAGRVHAAHGFVSHAAGHAARLGHLHGASGRVAHGVNGTLTGTSHTAASGLSRTSAGRATAAGRAATVGVGGAAASAGVIAARQHAGRDHMIAPQAFAANRNFARDPAFARFAQGAWHRHNRFHVGWVGPLFWPYAYGDLFYDTLWPAAYWEEDPFWDYGYDDIYQTVFWPYGDTEYVRGREAARRRTALTHAVTQTCNDETGEVTGWPVDQIQQVVQPDQQQRADLDALGNAIVKAAQVIRSACPAHLDFTPPGRLDQMRQRIEALIEAANIVRPALATFYDSLNDDQKARFNAMGAPGTTTGQASGGGSQPADATRDLQASCGGNITPWPGQAVSDAVHPNDAQRAKLDALQKAADQASEVVKASCPSEIPATPPGRLDAEIKRLEAILQGIKLVQPALSDFYASLNDEQKAQFNRLGQRLASRNGKAG